MKKCVQCQIGEYETTLQEQCCLLNHNNEFVKGYGHEPVFISKNIPIKKCNICGHIDGSKILPNPTETATENRESQPATSNVKPENKNL
ncbi:MAG: hypothetical protein ACOCVA_00960 [Prolixibacteraceae bacterium]